MDRDALLDMIAAGQLDADSRVGQRSTGRPDDGPITWQPLATWYLDNSMIRPKLDTEDAAYVARYLSHGLDGMALRRSLGFSDTADQIAGLTADMVMNRILIIPDWARLMDVESWIDREIIVPTTTLEDAANIHDVIGVPSWGIPYDLSPKFKITVPDWQDPATAEFLVPELELQQWRRVAVVAGAGERARRTDRDQAKRDQAKRDRVKRDRVKRAPTNRGRISPPPPPPPPELKSAAPAEIDARSRALIMDRLRSWTITRTKAGRTPGKTEVRNKFAALRRAVAAEQADQGRVRTAETPSTGHIAPPVRRDDGSRRTQLKPRKTGLEATQPRRSSPPVAPATAATATAADAEKNAAVRSGMVTETSGSGCLGCFGQLIAMSALCIAALVAVDLGMGAFVTSELGISLSDRDPERASPGRGLRARLISQGPMNAPLVAVLRVDASAAGTKIIQTVLGVLRPGKRQDGLHGNGRIRLVLLPTGTTPVSTRLAATMLVLQRRGLLFERLGDLAELPDRAVAPLRADALLANLDEGMRASIRKQANSPSVMLQVRTYQTMATALGIGSPGLLLNGVRVQARGLSSTKLLSKVLAITVEATNAAIDTVGSDNPGYWPAVLTPLKPRVRERFLSWIVHRERLPTTQRKAGAKSNQPGKVARPDALKNPMKAQKKKNAPALNVVFSIPRHAPRLGSDKAPVRVVVFADLHDPFSRKLAPRLKRLRDDFGDDVQLIFLHYPLTGLHPGAKSVARIAVAAHAQGQFWPLHDHIYSQPVVLAGSRAMQQWLFANPGKKPINVKKFRRDRKKSRRVLRLDRALGRKLRIRGTPTTFINGRRINGAVPYTQLRAAVERALKRKEQP